MAARFALARVSLVAAAGGFLFGYDTAVINGANQFLTAYFSLSPAQEGLAASSAIMGCIPGALVGGALSDRVGRKSALFLCATLFLISGLLSALPGTFPVFVGARFLGGLAIGVCSMVCPIYIGECAPAAMRGRLGSLFQLGIVVGIFLTLFLNAAIQGRGDASWNVAYGWRYMLGSEAMPAALFLLLLRRSPESPRWLIQNGRVQEARDILAGWTEPLRINPTIDAIRDAAGGESGSFRELFEPRLRRPLIIAVGLAAVAQLSGINAIMYYSTRIFTTAGLGVANAFTATVVIGLINLVFTLLAVSLMDRAGRRLLLLVGLTAQVASLTGVAWMFHAHSSGVAVLIAILIFIASFALALGPIPWLLSSEIFPARIRGRAMSVAAFAIWASCLVVAQAFPILNDSPSIGPAMTFGVFAAISFAGLLFTFFLVPETKGRSLEEIDASLAAEFYSGSIAKRRS